MMIEIKEETFTLKLFGEAKEIAYPTGDSVEELNEKLSTADKGKELKVMREFFATLGLEEKDLKRLQLPHFMQIMKGLTPKKN